MPARNSRRIFQTPEAVQVTRFCCKVRLGKVWLRAVAVARDSAGQTCPVVPEDRMDPAALAADRDSAEVRAGRNHSARVVVADKVLVAVVAVASEREAAE